MPLDAVRVCHRAEMPVEWLGRFAAWLMPALMLVAAAVVVLRYLFDLGWIALQETVIYLHALIFMLGMVYALKHDGHVRVDVLYRYWSERGRTLVDLAGTVLFLIPLCLLILSQSWGYVGDAWQIKEGSSQTGGLPAVYLLKSLIPLTAALLLWQGLWQATRQTLALHWLGLLMLWGLTALQVWLLWSAPDIYALLPEADEALAERLPLYLFAFVGIALIAGYPVAFTLGGAALLFAFYGAALDIFDLDYLSATPSRLFGVMNNETLVAVPLFIFMGVLLERSGIAERLLLAMGYLLRAVPGGLSIAIMLVGMLLAASTGIVGATVVTLGLLALPTLLKQGYEPSLAAGTVCASGTLGQIIPPSIILILLGDQLSSAYQQAQLNQGIYAPETLSVGDLFAGALLPGIVLVMLYIAYLAVVAYFRPLKRDAAVLEAPEGPLWQALLPPLGLIFLVLGAIISGAATPTEAAAVGALGAFILAVFSGRFSVQGLAEASRESLRVNAMIFMILIGASVFSLVFRGYEGDEYVAAFLSNLPEPVLAIAVAALLALALLVLIGLLMPLLPPHKALLPGILALALLLYLVILSSGGHYSTLQWLQAASDNQAGLLVTVMLVLFLLGFILDFIEITFVVIPVVAPILLMMGVDPVWLGVMIAINLQTSFLTPPFGFALFYLRGVAPAELPTSAIYRGAMPFIAIQALLLLLLVLWPQLATWLPEQVFGSG